VKNPFFWNGQSGDNVWKYAHLGLGQ
jgi:hypothetical protein